MFLEAPIMLSFKSMLYIPSIGPVHKISQSKYRYLLIFGNKYVVNNLNYVTGVIYSIFIGNFL